MVSPSAAKAARRAKHTPSSIDKLDPEIRELIGHLRLDKGWTIDEIRNRLISMGQQDVPSRSALGRHVRGLAEVTADLRETRVVAEAIAKEHGDSSQSQLLDANIQLLQVHLFKLLMAEKNGEPAQFSTKESQEASATMRNIALTRKTDLETIEKAEARGAKKATAEAAEKATKMARSKGLSKETVDAIRHAVLGSDV